MPSFIDAAPPAEIDSPFAPAIRTIEGWHKGSQSERNNNPGNLRFAGQPGATKDEKGFAKFPDYQSGYEALNRQIALDAHRRLTVEQFASKYAPAGDGNDPKAYAASLAKATGRKVTDPVVGPSSSAPPSKFQDAGSPFQDSPPPPSLLDRVRDVSTRAANGVLGGLGLPPIGDKSYSNPIHAGDVVDALNPWNMIKGIGQAGSEQMGKAADAAKSISQAQGIANKAGAIGNMLGHGAAAAIPTLAPAADAGDAMSRGEDPVKGIAQMATSLGATFGEPLRDTIKSLPDPEAFKGAPPEPTPQEANFQASAKKIHEAVKPGLQRPQVENSLRTVLPEYRDQAKTMGVDVTPDTRKAIGANLEAKYNTHFHNYLDPAIERGDMVAPDDVREAKLDAIPEYLRPDASDDLTNPAVASKNAQYQRYVDEANANDHPISIPSAYKRMQGLQQEMTDHFKKSPDQQYAAEVGGRPISQVKAEYDGWKAGLYKAIDPYGGGENVAEGQRRYADQITFRQQMDKLDNTLAQTENPSTVQKVINAAQGAGGLGLGAYELLHGNPVAGVPSTLYGGYRVGKALTPSPDIPGKISSAFKGYKGPSLDPLEAPPDLITPPRATPDTDFKLSKPSGSPEFSVQHALFGNDHPAWNDSQYREAIPPEQLLLTRPDPKTFDWQRVLNFDMPDQGVKGYSAGFQGERPVDPTPVNP